MTALNKDALKALFQTGSTITQTSMSNLIDSFIDVVDTSAQTIASPIIFNSNATFTSPVATSSGGTGQSSYIDGQLLIGNSSGNTLTKATLTAGTNVTITNGNGSIVITAATGGASGVLIQTIVASADSTITFDNTKITSTYQNYKVEISNLVTSVSGIALFMDFSQSGSFLTGGGLLISESVGSGSITALSDSGRINLAGIHTDTALSSNVTRVIVDLLGATGVPPVGGFAKLYNHLQQWNTGFELATAPTTPIDGVRFVASSGNFTTGTFKLYGVS